MLFVIVLFTANLSATTRAENSPQFAPIEIQGALPFQIRYVYRQAGQDVLKPLTSGSILRAGDFYGIEFTPLNACYVYIFQLDQADTLSQLFPGIQTEDPAAQSQLNPVQNRTTYYIPSADALLPVSPSTLPKQLYFLASAQPDAILEEYYRNLIQERQRQNALRAALFHIELLKRIQAQSLSRIEPLIESAWIEKEPLNIPELQTEIASFFDFHLPQALGTPREAKGAESYSEYASFANLPKVSLFNIFAETSDQISPEAYPLLHEYGKAFTQDLPQMILMIVVHTDQPGNAADNLKLAQRRAESVRQFFIIQYQIAPDRLQLHPIGNRQPLASPDTPEGRRLNNRIELIRVK